jgi:hypothetical protein
MSKARKFKKERRESIRDYVHPKGEPIRTNETLLRAWLGGGYDFPFKPRQHNNKLPRTFLRPDASTPQVLTFDGIPIAEHLPDNYLLVHENKENAVYYILRQLLALMVEYGWQEVEYEPPSAEESIKEIFSDVPVDVEIEDTLADIFG